MSSEPHSVSILLHRLSSGDDEAAGAIWSRYVEQLLPLAKRKLRGLKTAAADEEDVLISVFDKFFRAARSDRFTRLENRDDLWQILLMMTERRVADQYRKSHAQKRGSGRVVSVERITGDDSMQIDQLQELADSAPTPEFAAAFADQIDVAFRQLPEGVREVAVLRMEGHSVKDIAEEVGISVSSVERKLRLIRTEWQNFSSESGGSPDLTR